MSVIAPKRPDPPEAENWDEDFEFNAATHTHSTTACSGDDGDKDSDIPAPSRAAPTMTIDPTTPGKDKKNGLGNWTEPGPSTPLRRHPQTENWDDDFQDADSPGPSVRRTGRQNGAVRVSGSGSPVENWDEEFEDNPRHGTSPRRRTPRKKESWGSSDDEDDTYGYADKEDDRTVTSRSRGMPFAITNDVPPVPPLPSPFPRSPTASVFSVPVSSTGRDSSAGYSYSSTAHLALRPTVSGNSAVAARLALLPPSPPIHRERRRLRKKSRPPHQFEEGIFELDDRAELEAQPRPVTPPSAPPPDDPLPDVGNTSTATTKTPLLSRIGSVGKKWSSSRKKRSTGPTEIPLQEREERGVSRERHRERERERQHDSGGSRPTSFIASSSPGHGGAKGWFFRGGGGSQGPGSAGGSSPGHESSPLKHEKSVERLLQLMGVDRGREPGSPTSIDRKGKARAHGREGTSSSALPTDLDEPVDGTALPNSALFGGGTPRRPTSMQVSVSNSSSESNWNMRPPVPRHVSYSDGRRPKTPSSRASSKPRSASASVEDVNRRAKKSSTASASARETSNERSVDAHGPPVDGDEKAGGRRFMGNIRRISLVGSKHKRQKSITPEDKRLKTLGTALAAHEAEQDQSTPRPPSRTIRSSIDVPLLPPIELQPPSPPRSRKSGERKSPRMLATTVDATTPTRTSIDRALETSRSYPSLAARRPSQISQSASGETALPTIPSPLPSPTRPRPSTSPVQTASLGRTAQPPKERDTPSNSAVPRRNSLGDLKIPARISQAQVGLRRDLSMVRDFATSVEQLKQLQLTYTMLAGQVRAMYNEPTESQSRPVSPSFIHLPKPSSRSRANTAPTNGPSLSRSQLNTAFLNIEAKYRLSWECAELLIDLGGGAPAQPHTSPPPSSTHSVPSAPSVPIDGRKSRERAITLGGDEPKPSISPSPQSAVSPPLASPPPSQWRASTGRHDLSHRQLLLLREMLNNSDPSSTMSMHPDIPEEEINRNWRWGDAMNSTVTLPSEESGVAPGTQRSPSKKRRAGRLGMRHIRDMLRSLKKQSSQSSQQQPVVLPHVPASTSSVSASTDSSLHLPRESSRPQSALSRRRGKTSSGPESVASRRDIHPNSPYGTTPVVSAHKSSPRRPSLASIFRIGQKAKPSALGPGTGAPSMDELSSATTTSRSGTSLGDGVGEDWDHVESVSDLDHAARVFGLSPDGTATVRGKKGRSPYLFGQRGGGDADGFPARAAPEASLSSLFSPTSTGTGSESPTKKPMSAIPPSTLQAYQRSIKLSDVREVDSGDEVARPRAAATAASSAASRARHRQSAPSPSPSSGTRRPPSRGGTGGGKPATGSVRSAPPQPWTGSGGGSKGSPSPSPEPTTHPLPLSGTEARLAMAPENIRPLLENAREVHARCSDCIAELEALLGSGVSASPA